MPPRERQKLQPRPEYGRGPYKPAPMPEYGTDPRYKPAPMPEFGTDPRYKPAPMPEYGFMRSNFQPDQSGLMGAMANNPMVQQAKNLYNKIDPWIPDLDVGGNNLGYSFEKPLLGGTLGFGMDYGWDDEDIGAFINWKTGLGA